MKNSTLSFLFFFLISSLAFAQKISYGLSFGANYISVETDGADENLYAGDSYSPFNEKGFPVNIGGYFDYSLNESFGIKANLFYSKNVDEYLIYSDNNESTELDVMKSAIKFQPLLKFDVNKEYGKGFYLLAGPQFSFILNEEDARNNFELEENFYKSTNIGANLGFGLQFSSLIGAEIIGYYGLSNWIDNENIDTSTAGAYLNVYINLASIINK
ncbi:outer membrane beta-barrel protein [Mesonia aquimarina]|uniref:outer membrane beta-barrel protein n=1 Tax=Mesonia aquimarina TaxID=1504967 RepID=UPI000EF615DA|nr:outer membrane beta-barrel protein [Mesonia aquimarina]